MQSLPLSLTLPWQIRAFLYGIYALLERIEEKIHRLETEYTKYQTSYKTGVGGIGGAIGGFTSGFGMTLVNGGTFGQALENGGIGAVVGAGTAVVFAGAFKGIGAAADGIENIQTANRAARIQKNEWAMFKFKMETARLRASGNDGTGGATAQVGGGAKYTVSKGNMSPTDFRSAYSGMTEDQMMVGKSSFMGYTYKNDMFYGNTRFVVDGSGKEVDMIHFMVVGRSGHMLGIANEIQQTFRRPSSAFSLQDLYSNYLGVKFFNRFGPQIQRNPTYISNYIFDFLSDPIKYK